MQRTMRRALALLVAAFAGLGASAAAAQTWHVFLIAGDREEPVFDNAVDRLAALFQARHGIAAERFSARVPVPAGKRAATWQEIARTIRARPIGPADSCFFYFTSHGEAGGLYMARHDALIPPEEFAALIGDVCGARPTVLVVSACHSGTFVRPGLTRDNWVVLTAARRDRSSFGCSHTEELTVYDRCFMAAWPRAGTWPGVHQLVANCVSATEQQRRFTPPSLPQAHFGRATRRLPVRPQAAAPPG